MLACIDLNTGKAIPLVSDTHKSSDFVEFLKKLDREYPTHSSWLNLIESFFSKMTKQMLRGIRVDSKQELIDRIYQYFDEVNEEPVIYHWKYKMDEISEEEINSYK